MEAGKMQGEFTLKQAYAFALGNAAHSVGELVMDYRGEVRDVQEKRGHEESTVDVLAYHHMLGALESEFSKIPHNLRFGGKYRFEIHDFVDLNSCDDKPAIAKGVLRIDEIDGTTNMKRALASPFDYRPAACVSIALSLDESLGSIVIGAVYDIMNEAEWTSIKVEDGCQTWYNGRVLDPRDFEHMQGDTVNRVMVVGYSNTKRTEKGLLEQALVDELGSKCRTYDGSRSSTFDILSILRNQYDAYVDPRALWPDSGAVLHPYDVAGAILIAEGCGLEVSDLSGNPISEYNGNGDLHIIIARPGLREQLLDSIQPLIKQWQTVNETSAEE
jgi:fructose-1,6-bisphosphatase/inositol monophosphatase family enzyme